MSVADAYVDLHVNGDHLASEIRTSVRKTEPLVNKESDRIGESFGKRMADRFVSGFKKQFGGGSGGKIGQYLKNTFKGFNPRSLMIPALVAIIPVLTSTLSALAGTLTALTGAVVQAGGASLAFVGILGSLVQGLVVAKLAFSGFGKAVSGDEEAMKSLAPAAQATAKAVAGLSKQWKSVTANIQSKVFAGLADEVSRLGTTLLPLLRQQLGGTGYVINKIIKDVAQFATSRSFIDRFGVALWNNNRILERLGKAIVPGLSGLLDIFIALQPSAKRLSKIIVDVVKNFANMAGKASTAERLNDFMKRAFDSASKLWRALKGLGTGLINVFSAATGPGNKLLGTLARLGEQFADFTGKASSQSAIAKWARQGIETTKGLFNVIADLWRIIKPLFNPQLAGGVFSVFEKVLPAVVAVGMTIKDALMPIIEGLISAWADLGPKVGEFASAIAPLLKGVGSVIGELIKQTFAFVGSILSVVTPIVKIISNFIGPILTKFAPVIAFLIFAFTNWSSSIIKVIPYIGKFTAPIVKLSEYLYGKFIPAFQFIGKVVGKVLPFIAKGFKLYFGIAGKVVGTTFSIISKVVGTYLKIVMAIVSKAWGFIKLITVPVFKFLAKFIGTYVKIWWTVISAVIRTVIKVVSKGFNAVKAVVTPVVRFVANMVKRYFGIVRSVISAVAGFIGRVFVGPMKAMWNIVSTGIGKVVGFIKGLPQKILALSSNFLNAGVELGKKVIQGIWNGLKAVGGAVLSFGESLKNAINSALHLPVHINGPGPLPDFDIPAFARGGISRGGLALVGERGPELVSLPRDSRVYSNSQSRNMLNDRPRDTMPRKMILRIGNRDFEAYVSEMADDRIAAADSLAWQGA